MQSRFNKVGYRLPVFEKAGEGDDLKHIMKYERFNGLDQWEDKTMERSSNEFDALKKKFQQTQRALA